MPGDIDIRDLEQCIRRIQAQVEARNVEVSAHAEDEMVQEETGRIRLAEVLEAIGRGRVLENYPDAQRGPCCLIYGTTEAGRPLHVVCTTSLPTLRIITVYHPTPPKWTHPTRRGHTP